MNKHYREQVRLSCLRYCLAAGGLGLGTMVLHQALRAEGLGEVTLEELRDELRYLEEKGLLQRKPKLISPENEIWQVTSQGRDLLAENDQ